MKNNFFLTQQTDDLLHSVPVRDYFSQKIIASESPFLPVSPSARMKIAFMNGWFWIAEKLLGSKLSVGNDLRELFFIDSRIRSLLSKLVEKGVVSSWMRTVAQPDFPSVLAYRVLMHSVKLSSGKISIPQGNFGEGSGDTPNRALIPALAELFERHSLFVWNPEKIIRGTYQSLKDKRAVNPDLFSFFSKQQRQSGFLGNAVTLDTEIGWVSSQSFISGRKYLIPAQLVYILYSEEYPNEPYFWRSTTNGAAAGVSFDQATYRALCEAIERDGLFSFWLNGISPPVIDLESIPFPKVREHVANIKKHKLELFVLDITTDLEVPSFCAVLIDRFGEIAVSISTVTDFDTERSLEKLLSEAVQTLQFENVEESIPVIDSQINTFEQRRFFWSRQEMIPRIAFFLQGKKKDFSEMNVEYAEKDIHTKLDRIKCILQEKNYNCFLIDVTSEEAHDAGLFVVKAVLPQLVPAYFDEKEKPLGVKRLYTLPVTLGYRMEPLTENDLNPIPHPFI